jgi:hypothetical protein
MGGGNKDKVYLVALNYPAPSIYCLLFSSTVLNIREGKKPSPGHASVFTISNFLLSLTQNRCQRRNKNMC